MALFIAVPSPGAGDERAIPPAGELLCSRCLACHDADGPAPLRLDTPAAVLRHRRLMQALIADRTMPPASAESPFPLVASAAVVRHGIDEREREALLAALVSDDSARAAFASNQSSAPKPDPTPAPPDGQRVTAASAWTVPAVGGMRIRSFHAPLPSAAPTRIRGWRMVAQGDPARSPIRFMSFAADPARAWRLMDDDGSGAESMGDIGSIPSGALGALSRTAPEFLLPDGCAFELPPGDLIIETTVEPIGREAMLRPSVELIPATDQSARIVRAIAARVVPLEVAAGERVERVVSIDPGGAARLVGIVAKGGAYLRGFVVETVAPDGCRTTVARDRDFRMNLTAPVVLSEPLAIEAGSIIEVRFDLDNTRGNPLQPFDPPRALIAGLPPEGEDAAVVVLLAPATASTP